MTVENLCRRQVACLRQLGAQRRDRVEAAGLQRARHQRHPGQDVATGFLDHFPQAVVGREITILVAEHLEMRQSASRNGSPPPSPRAASRRSTRAACPGKRQSASRARLTALNSMWASAWTSIARPSSVTIERRPTRRGGTSTGRAGRPGIVARNVQDGAAVHRPTAGGISLRHGRHCLGLGDWVGFKQALQRVCAQLKRWRHRMSLCE